MNRSSALTSSNQRASLARVDLRVLATPTARDVAAPMKLAVALPRARVLVRVVSAAAAQLIAAVLTRRSPVAAPAVRADRPSSRVRLAVTRRPVDVHQVAASRLFVRSLRTSQFEEDRLARAPTAQGDHLAGFTVLLHQLVADDAEARQCRPTRARSARTGHAVTLTFGAHRTAHRLQRDAR